MKSRSSRLAVCAFALMTLSSYPAFADVVGPDPETCPDGSLPAACHGGPYCHPANCSSDADCDPGETCSDTPLCTAPIDCGGLGGPSPSTNVLGACGASCTAGTCTTLQVCHKATSPTGSGGSGGDGGSGGNGGSGGSGGSSDDYAVKGCTCSLEQAPTLGSIAAALAFLTGLSAFSGRRRSRRRAR